MCTVLNRAVKLWDLQGSLLSHCSALVSPHAAAPQPHGSTTLEQLWEMEGGGDDVPGEGQADLTPLPAAKCSMGSAVIAQNRATVCASSKRQSLMQTYQGIAWGSDFLQEPPREMPALCPTCTWLLSLSPTIQAACRCLLQPGNTRNRAWPSKECRQGLGRREERSCINLTNPPHVAVTCCPIHKGSPPGRGRGAPRQPLWQPCLSGISYAARGCLCFPKQRHILPIESSSSQVTTYSSPYFAARSLLKHELLQSQLAQHLASVSSWASRAKPSLQTQPDSPRALPLV